MLYICHSSISNSLRVRHSWKSKLLWFQLRFSGKAENAAFIMHLTFWFNFSQSRAWLSELLSISLKHCLTRHIILALDQRLTPPLQVELCTRLLTQDTFFLLQSWTKTSFFASVPASHVLSASCVHLYSLTVCTRFYSHYLTPLVGIYSTNRSSAFTQFLRNITPFRAALCFCCVVFYTDPRLQTHDFL